MTLRIRLELEGTAAELAPLLQALALQATARAPSLSQEPPADGASPAVLDAPESAPVPGTTGGAPAAWPGPIGAAAVSPPTAQPQAAPVVPWDACTCPDWWRAKVAAFKDAPGYWHYGDQAAGVFCARHRHKWPLPPPSPDGPDVVEVRCECGAARAERMRPATPVERDPCSEEGCAKPVYAKGRCQRHYTFHLRQQRAGAAL